MDAGQTISSKELRSRVRVGENYLGAMFIAGLETLSRNKEEEESKKLQQTPVNPLAVARITVC